MKRTAARYATFALLGCLAWATCIGSPPARAAELTPGTHAGTLQGALYRIDVPEHWNGDLVMVMHGYQPVGARITTPMKAADATADFLKLGYAVAQSQYASQGWAVGDAIADTEGLRQYVIRTFGHPAHTYLYGFTRMPTPARWPRARSPSRHPSSSRAPSSPRWWPSMR